MTPSQKKAIEANKKNFKKVGATFKFVGYSEFKRGFIVCELVYTDGRKLKVMIGKRGNHIWE